MEVKLSSYVLIEGILIQHSKEQRKLIRGKQGTEAYTIAT
jgi:hypothetical protein